MAALPARVPVAEARLRKCLKGFCFLSRLTFFNSPTIGNTCSVAFFLNTSSIKYLCKTHFNTKFV